MRLTGMLREAGIRAFQTTSCSCTMCDRSPVSSATRASRYAAIGVLAWIAAGCTVSPEATVPAATAQTAQPADVKPLEPTAATSPMPLIQGAHWHHFHFNSVDPTA